MKKSIKERFKYWKANFEYKYTFLNILNSPFVLPKLKFYFGEIRHGTPYFLPRKWVKFNKQDCIEALEKDKLTFAKINREVKWGWMHYKGCKKAVSIKYFHWYFTSLGWKTKWNDYRFEWSPSLSIVLFGKQLFITLVPDQHIIDQYWEGWLYYNYRTNKKLSVEERLIGLFNQYTCTWTSYKQGEEKVTTDYYPLILKRKYLKIYNEWKINKLKGDDKS